MIKHNLIYCYSIIAAAIFLFSSCTAPRLPRTAFTSLQNIECEKKPENIQLYFQGENVDFKYEKVGMIEVVSHRYERTERMLDYIKHRAWLNCADAVINVKQDYKTISSSSGETIDVTTEKIFYGLAVKLQQDQLDTQKTTIDTSFVQTVLADERYADQVTKNNRKATASFAVLIFLTYVIIVLL